MPGVDLLRALRPVDVGVASACGLSGIGILLLLPQLTAGDPELGAGIAAFGTVAWWLAAVAVLTQSLLLSWGRHAPRTVVIAVSAIVLGHAATLPGAVLDVTALPVAVAVFLAVRAAALATQWWSLATAAVLVGLGNLVNSVLAEGTEPLAAVGETLVQLGGLFGIPLLLATMLRARRESREAQRRELRALTRERDALIEAAVSRERTAMARELHDIAAHHLSGIALMASAMQRQVRTDPDAAQASAGEIRAESRAVLQNLRRVVGMLRVDGGAERSVESFAAIPDLVAELGRVRGLDVPLEVKGSVGGGPLGDGIGPLAQLAAYRTIQEALANAAMHAPGAACVVELDDTAGDVVQATIRNGPSGAAPTSPGGGFGLVGMRERADLIGAALHCGPTPDGGWEVRLVIPRDTPIGRPHDAERNPR